MDVTAAALLAAAGALAASAWVLYRGERAEQRRRAFDEKGLYASGAAAASRPRASRSPLGRKLHEAGIDDAPALWCARTVAAALVAGAAAWALSSAPAVGAVLAAATLVCLSARLAVLRKRRMGLLEAQFARMLPQVAANVRGALTLERALRSAAAHADDPLREELARVLADTAYGRPLAASLEEMALRTGSLDVKAFAAAVRIQQRFGGAIAPAVDMVASHADARLGTKRELRTELAGTRLAKWFVAGSMPAIFMIMHATNEDFSRFYAQEPLGWALVALAALLEAIGLFACHRITKVDGAGV